MKLIQKLLLIIPFLASCQSTDNVTAKDLESIGNYSYYKGKKYTGNCYGYYFGDDFPSSISSYLNGVQVGNYYHFNSKQDTICIGYDKYHQDSSLIKYNVDTVGYREYTNYPMGDNYHYVDFWLSDSLTYSAELDSIFKQSYFSKSLNSNVEFGIIYNGNYREFLDWKSDNLDSIAWEYVKKTPSPNLKEKLETNGPYSIHFEELKTNNGKEYFAFEVFNIEFENGKVKGTNKVTWLYIDYETKVIYEWDDFSRSLVDYTTL